MSNMMGMSNGIHKMGQQQDIPLPKTLGGFMNPTKTYGMQQNIIGVRMGMMGMMGMGMKDTALASKKANWVLVKKTDGQCACTQKPSKQIIIGRFFTQRECEDKRAHNC